MLDPTAVNVLVGVPSGDVGDAALDVAAAEARRRGIGVHLVHAMDPVLLAADPQTWALMEGSLREAATEVLQRTERRVHDLLDDDGAVSTELVHGPAVPALAALSSSAAVVVLQRRPATTWHGVPTHSVTNGVAARSRVPVLVVPTEWQERPSGAPVAVGVKDPALSGEVVRAALLAARARNAGLRIVHAWHYSSAFDDLVFEGDARVEHEGTLRNALSDALQEVLAEYTDVEVEIVVEHGHPGELLTRESRDACLLVLGRHQTRLRSLHHLGSVVRGVLRGAECPTMVVDPLPEREQVPASSPVRVARPDGVEQGPVVAAVDGSPGSESAIRKAVHEARGLGAPVRLVHVMPDYVPMSPMMPLIPEDLMETASGILKGAERVARSSGPNADIETRLVRGSRVRGILDAAADAQLLVLGQDRGYLERLVSGRTAAGVAARASCPVETVPSDWRERRPRGAVVLGIEDAEASRPALAQGFRSAAERHARLVVLHAWKMPTGYDDIIESRVAAADFEHRFTADLEPLLAEPRARFPEVPVEIKVVHDRPVHALVAASDDADLVVLMRRPHVMPGARHLGATAMAVLRAAQCAVRIVPPATAEASAGAPIEESAPLSGVSGRR
jgi:nucleotide-binding universal stress UspA family protein